MFNMKHADSESPCDIARWLQSESADLWPAVLGSLSLRRSRCIHENCPVFLSGEQHQSYVQADEKTREFKDGQRFRAGIEGRISGRGMKRCLAEGRERFELWVAAAVLANNLMKIAALLTDRSLRRRKAA
jgi:hypothetical protein